MVKPFIEYQWMYYQYWLSNLANRFMFFTSCSSKRRIFSRQAEIQIKNFSAHDDTNFYSCDKAGLKFT